jgi:hypothetical protein
MSDESAGGPVGVADDAGDDGPEEGNRALAPTATEVVGYLVRSLVDDPDAVRVHAIERRRTRRS